MKKIFCLGFLLIGFLGIAQSDKNPELSKPTGETLICINTGYSAKDNCQSVYTALSPYDMCLDSVLLKIIPNIKDLEIRNQMVDECVKSAVIIPVE